MTPRPRPLKPAGPGIRAVAEGLAPAGTLASVQAVWDQVAGEAVAGPYYGTCGGAYLSGQRAAAEVIAALA